MDKLFREFQYEQLKRDILFDKIPSIEIPNILAAAHEIGDQVRKNLKTIENQKDLMTYFFQRNIQIIKKTSRKYGPVIVYAEYQPKLKELFLYQDNIATLNLAFTQDISTFILLHELFHILEQEQSINYRDYYQFDTIKWGPFKKSSSLIQLSELAANDFAYQIQNKWRDQTNE